MWFRFVVEKDGEQMTVETMGESRDAARAEVERTNPGATVTDEEPGDERTGQAE